MSQNESLEKETQDNNFGESVQSTENNQQKLANQTQKYKETVHQQEKMVRQQNFHNEVKNRQARLQQTNDIKQSDFKESQKHQNFNQQRKVLSEHNQYESYENEHHFQNYQQEIIDPRSPEFTQSFQHFNDVQPESQQVSTKISFKQDSSTIHDQSKHIITQVKKSSPQTIAKQEPIKQVDNSNTSLFNQFTTFQTKTFAEIQQKKTNQLQSSSSKSQSVSNNNQTVKNVQSSKKEIHQVKPKKKNSKTKKNQQQNILPVIGLNSQEGKKQIQFDKKFSNKSMPEDNIGKGQGEPNNKKPAESQSDKNVVSQNRMSKQQPLQNNNQQNKPQQQVSQIVQPASLSANIIIFEAQRERIGSTLQYFHKFLAKHEKHTTNQKQLINNVQEQIQKKRLSKQSLCNILKDYFNDFQSMSKQLYEKSYKFVKNDKIISPNPMINVRQQLKAGYDELIFLRKSTGNDFHRLEDFVSSNIQRSIVKVFTDYWNSVALAQSKNLQKKQEYFKKEKQFIKRISKVEKVYTKGKAGIPQQQDLFVQMTKFINQQKEYRKSLIQYGLGLIPFKKAFIKAQQILYQELQVIFNTFKNQCRNLYCLHPKQFIEIQRFQKLVKQNNTFQKLSDITDGDYVRSVLTTLQKTSIPVVGDRQYQKVLNLLHFEQIVGSSVQLLKGTTSKSFDLKNKAQQVVDSISGNLLIFNKQTAEMKQKFIIRNINARIVQEGVVQIDEVIKGLIFDSNRTVRITFRDNDRAEELICFLNQIHESIATSQNANKK